MPIEFRCTCGKLLRTKDETAGKQAKCPECGTLVAIPMPGAMASDPGAGYGAPQAAVADAANPYSSPQAAAYDAPAVTGEGEIVPTRIDLSDVLSRTWTILKSNFLMCLVGIIVLFVINIGLQVVMGVVVGAVAASGNQDAATGAQVVMQILLMLASIWINLGGSYYMLNIAKGREPQISDLFAGGRWYVTSLGATIVFLVLYFVGFLLLIIPGLIVAMMLWPFNMLIIDRNVGAMESLSLARKITAGNKLTIFLIGVIMFFAAIVAIIPCGLGMLVFMPYVSLLFAVIYLSMTGQPTADQLRR